MTAGPRWADPRVIVPLVVGAAAVVVVATALEGRARVTPLVAGTPPPPVQPSPFALPSTGVVPHAPDPVATAVTAAVGTILTVLVAVVAIAVLVVLVRLLVQAIRRRPRRVVVTPIDAAGAAAELRLADATTVLRGLAAALAAFGRHREPTDAVVQAWLGLQQTAEDAGFARSPSETPTEFTGRVLTRSSADRDALGTLLRLYLRARFGDGDVTADDAAAALDALRALEASWGAAPAGRR